MRIVPRIFLLISLAVLAHAYDFNVDVGESLDGKIIHIESLRYRGYWLKSTNWNGRWLATAALPERNTYYTQWSQFLVKHIGGGVVLFESMTWRNHFFDAHHSGWVGLTQSTYPNDEAWAKWKIRCTSSDLTNCVIESMRYRGYYFDSHEGGAIGVTRYGDWYSRFRILSPKPSDYYRSIWSTENNSGAEQKKSLTLYEGTTDTTSTSNTITTTVSVEVQAAMVTASASISHEWQVKPICIIPTQREKRPFLPYMEDISPCTVIFGIAVGRISRCAKQVNTKTFEKQTTLHYDITIPPYSKIELKQLTGAYGPFRVQSAKFKIDQTNLKTGKRSKIVSKSFQI